MSRAEQVERNRELVLKAARRVFLAKGYQGATLDAIAEEAGFSKGVVYSQFTSKADLFLALLERRVAERADQNDKLANELAGRRGVEAAMLLWNRLYAVDPEWALLVIEFRTHAARDPALNERYKQVHDRTIVRLAGMLTRLNERAGIEMAIPADTLAEMILAISSGVALERAANPGALPSEFVADFIAQMATSERGNHEHVQAAGNRRV
jgi:AcrR family transcriptional regulator